MIHKLLIIISLICRLDAFHDYTKDSMSEDEMAAWDSFKNIYRPSYYHPPTYYGRYKTTTEEEEKRRRIFKANYQDIRNCNKKRQQDPCAHRCGVNKYTDRTEEEISETFGGTKNLGVSTGSYVDHWKLKRYRERVSAEDRDLMNSRDAPDSWSWVEQGGVTEVGNQGECGSCAAWAVVATVETCFWRAKNRRKPVVRLSKREVYECG